MGCMALVLDPEVSEADDAAALAAALDPEVNPEVNANNAGECWNPPIAGGPLGDPDVPGPSPSADFVNVWPGMAFACDMAEAIAAWPALLAEPAMSRRPIVSGEWARLGVCKWCAKAVMNGEECSCSPLTGMCWWCAGACSGVPVPVAVPSAGGAVAVCGCPCLDAGPKGRITGVGGAEESPRENRAWGDATCSTHCARSSAAPAALDWACLSSASARIMALTFCFWSLRQARSLISVLRCGE